MVSILETDNSMKLKTRFLVLAATAVLSVGFANAQTNLAAGGVVTPVPAIILMPDDIGATIAESQFDFVGLNNFNNIVFSGYLHSKVIQQTNGNLVFGYVLGNYWDSIDPISRLSITDFSGFSTAVAQGTPWNLFQPVDLATRSANGRVVSFAWLTGVQPAAEARYVYVYTDAKTYTKGSASVLNGGMANVSTFAPGAVPEPASIAVLGLGAAALIRRRRSQK